MIKLEDVYEAVRKVIPNGELYAVGGCVRDHLLGKTPKDWDFCTNLTPEQMKPLIEDAGRHVYAIGEKFGTLGFKVEVMEYNDYDYESGWGPQWHAMSTWVYVEVTTYRTERYEQGSRKPKVKLGTDLKEDLKRRDFTINSLAFDGKEIIDLFAGELDLNHKLIKSVGEPKQMINDDPLRILRAVRFSVQLGFDIEQNLERHLKRFCPKLFDVAIERQQVELDKMFAIDAEKSLNKLYDIGYIKYFLPEIMGGERIGIPKMKIPSPINSNKPIDEIWKKILSKSGEEIVFLEPGQSYFGDAIITNNHHDRTRFLNRGIAARFKFSNKRRQIVTGDK